MAYSEETGFTENTHGDEFFSDDFIENMLEITDSDHFLKRCVVRFKEHNQNKKQDIQSYTVQWFQCPQCEKSYREKDRAEQCLARGKLEQEIFQKIMTHIHTCKKENKIPFIRWNQDIIPVKHIQTNCEKRNTCGNNFHIVSLDCSYDGESMTPRIGSYGGFITSEIPDKGTFAFLHSYIYESVLKDRDAFQLLSQEDIPEWKPLYLDYFEQQCLTFFK